MSWVKASEPMAKAKGILGHGQWLVSPWLRLRVF